MNQLQLQRVFELQSLSRETGIPLPMPVSEIIKWEDQGHIVDLETGKIQWLQADRPISDEAARVLQQGDK